MSDTQRTILMGYLTDAAIDIDQIHFLSGGNVSQNELTVVYYSHQDGKVFRDADTIDGEGNTVKTMSAEQQVASASR